MLVIYTQDRIKKLKVKIRRVYYFLCYQYAHLLTHLLGNWRWIRGPIFHPIIHLNCTKSERNLRKTFCFLWGRRRVRHSKIKSKEDQIQELTFANIIEYATTKEYNEVITKQVEKELLGKSKGSDKEVNEKSSQKGKEEVKKATETKDPWA